jgi:hypothetical protein
VAELRIRNQARLQMGDGESLVSTLAAVCRPIIWERLFIGLPLVK